MVSKKTRVSSRLPRKLLEEYKQAILTSQGRQLEDDEAEMEAMGVLKLHQLLFEMEAQEERRKKLHRILTNGFKEPTLGPVDREFFGPRK